MKIYISGISGTGMGPLALMAKSAGIDVCGSDLVEGAVYAELIDAGIKVSIGKQDGDNLKKNLDGLDWFVYTSALPEDHAELKIAHEAGVKCTKRDDLTAFLVDELGLKMVAVAGTHGKTTTTAMIIWTALKLNLPVSYVVGTTLGFAPSGSYHDGDRFFIYEADEYDRNFLKFHPWLAVVTCVSYDHPDIYSTEQEYKQAFRQFIGQSENVIEKGLSEEQFDLAGKVRRADAGLAAEAVKRMAPDVEMDKIVEVLNNFPGVGRRFERIVDGVYSDYAHHPEEIVATMNVACEEAERLGYKGVVVVYQPHQNIRQHEVKDGYKDAFLGADKIFWLPTYLVREDPNLPILQPEELFADLTNKDVAERVNLNDELADRLQKCLNEGFLVLLMTAGPADEWLRNWVDK